MARAVVAVAIHTTHPTRFLRRPGSNAELMRPVPAEADIPGHPGRTTGDVPGGVPAESEHIQGG